MVADSFSPDTIQGEKNSTVGFCLLQYLNISNAFVPDFNQYSADERMSVFVEWVSSLGYDLVEYCCQPTDNRRYIAIGVDQAGFPACALWQYGEVSSDGSLLVSIKKYWHLEKIPLEDEYYYESVLAMAKEASISALLD